MSSMQPPRAGALDHGRQWPTAAQAQTTPCATQSPAGHRATVVPESQNQQPRVSGHKRSPPTPAAAHEDDEWNCESKSNAEWSEADDTQSDRSSAAWIEEDDDDEAAPAAPKPKKSKNDAIASSASAPRTADQQRAAARKAEKKNSFPEVALNTILARMPIALEGPLHAASSNGAMKAMSLEQVQAMRLPVDAQRARVLVRVVVSRKRFHDRYQGTSGGRHYATQTVFFNGVAAGTLDQDLLALPSFQDRKKQQAEQNATRKKPPPKGRSKQATRLPAECIVREFERFTLVSCAPNAFTTTARAKVPSQTLAQFGVTRVAQQAVGKGTSVATYLCFYVDRDLANAMISISHAQPQCAEHRRCTAHGECQLKNGYIAEDVMRSLNERGQWVEHSSGEYALPVLAKPTKLTTGKPTKAAAAVASLAAEAAAVASRTALAPRRVKYTTASKKVAKAAAAASATAMRGHWVPALQNPVLSPPLSPFSPVVESRAEATVVPRSSSSSVTSHSPTSEGTSAFSSKHYEQSFDAASYGANSITDLTTLHDQQSTGSPCDLNMCDSTGSSVALSSPNSPLSPETEVASASNLGLGDCNLLLPALPLLPQLQLPLHHHRSDSFSPLPTHPTPLSTFVHIGQRTPAAHQPPFNFPLHAHTPAHLHAESSPIVRSPTAMFDW